MCQSHYHVVYGVQPEFRLFVPGHSFCRVYAYNGRFLSPATDSLVHNRAILPPQRPAYFPQMSQTAIGVRLEYGNIQGRQISGPKPGLARPVLANAGDPTRIGITFTPDRDLVGTS